MTRQPGRHFLQIPGPTNVPDRVLRAIAQPVLDHRGPEFQALGRKVLDGVKSVFKTANPVIIFPSSGTGAWEGALANPLSPGDRVLMFETGQFAFLWKALAEGLGLRPDFIESDWRQGVDPQAIAARLRADAAHEIKAVCVVHNETSTGCVSDVPAVRAAIDAAGHPALLMVDTISSLGSMDYRHDEWGVDVTVGGSQKGLMLPAGLAFNAVGDKALAAMTTSTLPKGFFAWKDMLEANRNGFFPYTPATNLFYGLVESLDMLHEEGLDAVFARHRRHGEATRAAVRHWGGNGGLEILCTNPRHHSNSSTSILVPAGHSADRFRRIVLETFNMSLGGGLSRLADKVFRIGHLGDFSDLMLMGTLSGVEMGLELAGIPYRQGGAQAAMAVLTGARSEAADTRRAA